MVKRKNKIKILRYSAIFKRKVKNLNRKKISRWFRNNLRQHPFILGFLSLSWINYALIRRYFIKAELKQILTFHLYIIIAWFILVIVSNFLKDKYKVKWYLRKRFIAFMLIVLPPLGIVLLWSGSHFKKATKIILTVIFGAFFVYMNIYSNKRYEKILNKSPFDMIVETVSQPKKKVLLKTLDEKILDNLRLKTIPKRDKIKLAVSEIAKRCSPGVVSIKTKDKDGEEIGMASGFIISEDGIIVTNFHVVASAAQAQIKIGEKVFDEVFFVKGIPAQDIAVLKINTEKLPVLNIGDSDSLMNGQFIIVLGNPWGLERSVSTGIISAIRSKDNIKLIQMTAPVSPGSSGGPVINEYGEVTGITTLASIFLAQNLNFAIPISYLSNLLKTKYR